MLSGSVLSHAFSDSLFFYSTDKGRGIVFTATKAFTEELHQILLEQGWPALGVYGLLSLLS